VRRLFAAAPFDHPLTYVSTGAENGCWVSEVSKPFRVPDGARTSALHGFLIQGVCHAPRSASPGGKGLIIRAEVSVRCERAVAGHSSHVPMCLPKCHAQNLLSCAQLLRPKRAEDVVTSMRVAASYTVGGREVARFLLLPA